MKTISSIPATLLLVAAQILLCGCSRFNAPPPGPTVEPPTIETSRVFSSSLISVAAGRDQALLEARIEGNLDPAVNFELRHVPLGGDLSGVTGVALDPFNPRVLLTDLAEQERFQAQLFVQRESGLWQPTGSRVQFATGTVIYADAASTATSPNGMSPDSAYPSLFIACLVASGMANSTHVNVWAAEGTFVDLANVPIKGFALSGGFTHTFELAERNPTLHPTLIVSANGNVPAILTLLPDVVTGFLSSLDGLTIDGNGEAQAGVLVDENEHQLRSILITNCNRGFRLRAEGSSTPVDGLLLACEAKNNDLEGISIAGAWDMTIDGCTSTLNGQEGCQFDKLLCPLGTTAKVRIVNSAFAFNGSDGLDLDMFVDGPNVTPGGTFDVQVRNCLFAGNGRVGCLIDGDYELNDLWTADILVQSVSAYDNQMAGVSIDLDGHARASVVTSSSKGNGGDGFLFTSESQPGIISLLGCLAQANRGAGARSSFGQFALCTSHCALIGNSGGGMVEAARPGYQLNNAAWLQSDPWVSARTFGSAASNGDPLFNNAPGQIVRTAGTGLGFSLLDTPNFGAGATVEWNGDSTPREATSTSSSNPNLSPAPPTASQAQSLAWYPSGSIENDLIPTPTSALRGIGITALGDPLVDAGPLGLAGGFSPGNTATLGPEPFRLGRMQPSSGLGVMDDLVIELQGGTIDLSSVAGRVRVMLDDTIDSVNVLEDPLGLRLPPPVGGWLLGHRIEILGGASATSGKPLLGPLALPVPLP